MNGLKTANVEINRGMLADIVINDSNHFKQLVVIFKNTLNKMEK